MSTALQLRRRSQLLGTPVFVEGAVERLGFVSQVWVDVHTLRVAGWSIRCDRSPKSSVPKSSVAVPLSASKLLGTGALLLKSDALSTPLKTEAYGRLIPQVLKTQSGVSLGRLKDFTFDMASGAIASVRTSGTGIPLLPPAVDSTFEIPRTDLVMAKGSLTAADGAEERVTLLKRGLLEQAGIGKFDWSLPLSASEAPALDESTLEAIAAATASPLSVETTTAETTGDRAASGVATTSTAPAGEETAASSVVEPSSGATDFEDADTGPSDAAMTADKPLDRAIDVLTSTVQPLLQKLPSLLRQRLGLSDAEPETETSSSSAPEANDESRDSEEIAETSVDSDVTASAVDITDTTQASEPGEIAETAAEDIVEPPTEVTHVEAGSETEADAPPESSVDEDTVEITLDASTQEPQEEEESDEELEADSEVEEQSAREYEEDISPELAPELESVHGEESAVEDEPSPITAEADTYSTDTYTSDSEEDVEQPEATDEVEPSSSEEPDDSEAGPVETNASEDDEETHTLTGVVAATSAATATAIAGSQHAATTTPPESSEPEGDSVAPSSTPLAPSSTASQTPDTTVPPALQTSLPRVPRSPTQTTAELSQAKQGSPLQSFVSLPKSKGRVPKAGGLFEPKVKGS